MVFQEPMTSLNPVYTVGEQIAESIELHLKLSPAEAEAQAVEILRTVGISSPEMRVAEYPHQLSGGMRQRVLIGMALCCNPALLIADEPTTALDVTIQAQILELIRNLQASTGMAVLLITHDLAVVAESCDKVLVMYASKIVESADVKTIFADPLHPYTRGLFQSIPDIDSNRERLSVIPGFVPNPLDFPTGCKFHERCNCAQRICREKEPELREKTTGHFVACHLV
jgi:oligopeptide/dipeptide ABC transporter ATP-binding protein